MPTDGAPVFTGPGFSRGLTVDPRPGDPTPLRRRDVVVAVEGVPVNRLLSGRGPQAAHLRAGMELEYRVLRDEDIVEVPVQLRHGGLVAERLRDNGTPLVGLVIVVFGAYTVFRRPEQPAARALLVLGAGFVAYDVFDVLSADVADLVAARWLFIAGIAGTLVPLAAWNAAGVHMILSFPTPPTTMRDRPWLIPVLYATALAPPGAITFYLAWDGATLTGLARLHTALVVVLWATVALFMVGLIRIIIGARRDPTTRRQVALVVLGMGTSGLIFSVANVVAAGSQRWPWWFNAVAFFPMVAALAAAIVRGEFLDIRATINRVFLYASLTGVLLGLFTGTVAIVGALVGRSGVSETLPATAVVAVAFAPVRARLQRGIDRLLYGERGDPARVLGALGRRLEAALPPDQVLPTMVEAVALALRIPYVAIRTADGEAGQLACERGEPPSEPEIVPLVYQGQRVGELVVGPRRGERSLSATDRVLLGDVARHAAAAVRASSLLTEIAASRSRLAVAREEERARLRHDLHDRLGSHLVGLNLQLDTLASKTTDAVIGEGIRRAGSEADRALDEVRRISRGLRPAELDELGLVAAVSAATARLTVGDHDHGWHASVTAAVQLPVLPAATEAAAYHIAVEALTNAYRHSGAEHAQVRISVNSLSSRLIVEISDDGSGIAAKTTDGVGLRSMHERAAGVGGHLEISNGLPQGTVVRAELPLDTNAERR